MRSSISCAIRSCAGRRRSAGPSPRRRYATVIVSQRSPSSPPFVPASFLPHSALFVRHGLTTPISPTPINHRNPLTNHPHAYPSTHPRTHIHPHSPTHRPPHPPTHTPPTTRIHLLSGPGRAPRAPPPARAVPLHHQTRQEQTPQAAAADAKRTRGRRGGRRRGREWRRHRGGRRVAGAVPLSTSSSSASHVQQPLFQYPH